MGVPALAALVMAGFAVLPLARSTMQAERTRTLVAASGAAAGLVQALQSERVAVATVLSPGAPAEAVSAFRARAAQSRDAERVFADARRAVGAAPATVAPLLVRVDAALRDLDDQRARVGAGSGVGLSTATFGYRIVVADLVGFRQAAAQSGVEPALADQIRAGAVLSQAKEALGLAQVAVVQTLAFGTLTPSANQEIVAARAAFSDALQSFDALALPRWQALLGRTLTGEDVLAAQRLDGVVSRTRAYAPLNLPGGVGEWNRAMGAQVELLRSVESAVDRDVRDAVLAARDGQVVSAVVRAGLLLVGLVLALLVMLFVVRSMTSRLALLQQGVLAVSYERLPAMVAALQDCDEPESTAKVALDAVDEPLMVIPGRDEIGRLAAGFRDVYVAAVHAAADGAVQRIRVAQLFVVIGRRVQAHVERIIKRLDQAQKDEVDPEQLELMFGLDQLVTPLRRFSTTLLVHAGGGFGIPHREPVSLHDLLVGAMSEVEDAYHRTTFGEIAEMQVRSYAVGPTVYLLAELLNNAVVYSSPSTAVLVGATAGPDGVEVRIKDSGIGIAPELLHRFNAVLRGPAPEVAVSNQMGLAGVALVAAALQIRVWLESGRPSGTTAVVCIPANHLLDPATRPRPTRHPAGQPVADWPPVEPVVQQPDTETWRSTAVTAELPAVSPAPALIFEQVSAWMRRPTVPGYPGSGWSSPADEVWRAAARAATPVADGTTALGLPRRHAGVNLVPAIATDQVGPEASETTWRTPESVQAQTAAALRGLGAANRIRSVQHVGEQR